MSSNIVIHCRLSGTGWADCSVEIDAVRIDITASYLSDCFESLTNAAIEIIRGVPVARVSFDEEPGEYRWVLETTVDGVRVRILSFDKLWGGEADAVGQVLLEGTCSAQDLGCAVRNAMTELFDANGSLEYEEKWGYVFPTAQVQELSELVR